MHSKVFKLGFGRFFRLAGKACFRPRESHAAPSLKRFLLMAVFVPGLLVLQMTHWIAFLLDDLLFPAYRDVVVKRPVFIVGIPRSGTTLLQRVLARDEQNFTGFALWESLIAPSIVEWKFWNLLGRLDHVLGGGGRKLLGVFDRWFLYKLSQIHPSSLFLQEEDELLFLPIFSTVMLINAFPFPAELEHLARFDEDAPAEEKKLIMSFYKTCIQRHLYIHGVDKHYLAKNVLTGAKLSALQDIFPDLRVICNVRSPYNAVPSLLSLCSFFWSQFHNGSLGPEMREQFIRIAQHLYQHPMHVLPEWPEQNHVFVRYEDLRKNLRDVVTRAYERLGLEINDTFTSALEEEVQRSASFSSAHRYSMDDFGLTREAILERFGEVFEFFDFETG